LIILLKEKMEFLCNKNFWLPISHKNWTDVDYSYLPSFVDVCTYPVVIAFLLYFVRFIFER
jgi:hypothetical protein